MIKVGKRVIGVAEFPLITEKERKIVGTLGIQAIDWVEEPFKPGGLGAKSKTEAKTRRPR